MSGFNEFNEFHGVDAIAVEASPYERAYDKALKEVAVLRDSVNRLRDQIKPALQEELTNKEAADASIPEAPKSAVVRDFDNLRSEITRVSLLVQSISSRVHL